MAIDPNVRVVRIAMPNIVNPAPLTTRFPRLAGFKVNASRTMLLLRRRKAESLLLADIGVVGRLVGRAGESLPIHEQWATINLHTYEQPGLPPEAAGAGRGMVNHPPAMLRCPPYLNWHVSGLAGFECAQAMRQLRRFQGAQVVRKPYE